MSEDWTQISLRLKLLVGTMTALLAIGMGLLVVGVVRTVGELGGEPSIETAAPPAAAAFGESRIALPTGARLVAMTADAGRLYLRLETGDGQQQILVVDAASGRRLGLIRLEAVP